MLKPEKFMKAIKILYSIFQAHSNSSSSTSSTTWLSLSMRFCLTPSRICSLSCISWIYPAICCSRFLRAVSARNCLSFGSSTNSKLP